MKWVFSAALQVMLTARCTGGQHLSLLPWILQAPEHWYEPDTVLAPAWTCQGPCVFKGKAWVLVTSDLASPAQGGHRGHSFQALGWGVSPGTRP